MTDFNAPKSEALAIMRLAHEIRDMGDEMGLPFVAVSADIADPRPVVDVEGTPMAESVFSWIDPALEYWKDSAFALRAQFVRAARVLAEPFYVDGGKPGSWRTIPILNAIDLASSCQEFGVTSAIVCPCHLPHGTIGSIVWANAERVKNLPNVFLEWAPRLHVATLKFVSSYHDWQHDVLTAPEDELTRREIQCLKWAAAGKTDAEIAIIVGISQPTVRFHLNNTARKFGVNGRGQVIHRATRLGYVGNLLP